MVIEPTIIPLTVDSNTQNTTTNNNGQSEPGTPTFGGGEPDTPTFGGGEPIVPVNDQNGGGNDSPPGSPNSSSSEMTFGKNGPFSINDIPGNNQPPDPDSFGSIDDI